MLAAALVVLAITPLAARAQNNSLLGANRRAVSGRAQEAERAASVPPGQTGAGRLQNGQSHSTPSANAPAVRGPFAGRLPQEPVPYGGPALNEQAVGARATLRAERPDPRPNAVLLAMSPFAVAMREPEKIKVNDLITVIVRESKTAITDARAESKKQWKFDSSLTNWIRLDEDHNLVPAAFEEGTPAATFDYKNDYKTDGRYDRRDELTTRITVRVIDVKPNGNLVLEGRDEIRMDEDGYTITLIGECRARDVTPENTVLSTQVTNRQVIVNGKGSIRDATRRGLIQRALDFLRIF
ncbi:MAG: flagellar basal body L-ring protein FlgH [Planctomycetota bacterium]